MRLPANADQAPSSRAHKSHDPVSSSFILTVQHLIERCLTFELGREECARALAKHAGVHPVITVTVWKELEKANREFFEEYGSRRRRAPQLRASCSRVLQDTTNLRRRDDERVAGAAAAQRHQDEWMAISQHNPNQTKGPNMCFS